MSDADAEEERVAFLARKWSIPKDEARRMLEDEDDG